MSQPLFRWDAWGHLSTEAVQKNLSLFFSEAFDDSEGRTTYLDSEECHLLLSFYLCLVFGELASSKITILALALWLKLLIAGPCICLLSARSFLLSSCFDLGLPTPWTGAAQTYRGDQLYPTGPGLPAPDTTSASPAQLTENKHFHLGSIFPRGPRVQFK